MEPSMNKTAKKLWKKDKKDITEDDYNNFYSDKFMDYEKPLRVIHNNVEGMVTYKSLLYIPSLHSISKNDLLLSKHTIRVLYCFSFDSERTWSF